MCVVGVGVEEGQAECMSSGARKKTLDLLELVLQLLSCEPPNVGAES